MDEIIENGGEQERQEEIGIDEQTQQAQESAQEAEQAEQEQAEGKSAFGKFESAEKLMQAYAALENEHAKISGELANIKQHTDTLAQSKLADEKFIEQNILTSKAITDRVIGEYLRGLSGGRAPVTISGSIGAIPFTPAKKPKTLSEAGALAQKMLSEY